MRRWFWVVAIVLGLGAGYAGPSRLELFGRHPTMQVEPIAPPTRLRMGRLTWLGGIRLTSNDPAFGGFSALAIDRDRFTLLSDGGNVTTFTLTRGWQVRDPRFAALPDGPGAGWDKGDRDSESLTIGPGGRAWVGFETRDSIWRYGAGFARAERHATPRPMKRWPINGGAEAMVRLRDGRFVVLGEEARWPRRPGRAGLVFRGDPTVRPGDGFGFSYVPAPGHSVSDATQLPNGDLIVLERAWRLPLRFRFRLALLKLSQLRPGAVVRAGTLARIGPPWPIDNYEGIAVTREDGRTIVWLVSDNDNMWWRSNYLIKTRLD